MSRRSRSQAFVLRQLDLGTSKEYISMSSRHFVFCHGCGCKKKTTPSTFSWTDDEVELLFMKAFCGQNIEFAYIHVMLHT